MGAMSMLLSCSEDDEATAVQEQFFNLEEGNLWVYKKYTTSGLDGNQLVYSNVIDTVRITGQEVIAGETYYKLNHKYYNSGSLSNEIDKYLRVDSNGHLVNQNNIVIHPGTDFTYQFTDDIEHNGGVIGQVDYQLEEVVNMDVEGTAYSVYPFIGIFTPVYEAPPAGVACFWHYQPGIGIIQERQRFLASEAYMEYRLVYYEVN